MTVVNLARSAPSSIYDLEYRLTITACAFSTRAKQNSAGRLWIRSAELKLVQFVAIRPWLVAVVHEWAAARREKQLSLSVSHRLRRGFLGDRMHDDLVGFLVASGVLAEADSHLEAGAGVKELQDRAAFATSEGLFETERTALEALNGVRITNSMLDGWA